MAKRLTDLVDEINKKIEIEGDLLLHSYSISDEFEITKWTLITKDKDKPFKKNGLRRSMGIKEFREYCEKENRRVDKWALNKKLNLS